jgi:hypothetical protein
MSDDRIITTEHRLVECQVGPSNCGDDLLLFRAPVVRDGSGTYKRLPHQVSWEHIQEGDAIIAISLHRGPSGQEVIDILQFWNILRREDEETFSVAINNVVGMAGDGEYVYNRIASLVGLPAN